MSVLQCLAPAASGAPRMTFGIPDITDGISFVPIAIGLFGVAEMIRNLEQRQDRQLAGVRIANLLPTRAEMIAAFPAMLRGTAVGSLLGVLPGGGAALPPFSAISGNSRAASRAAEHDGLGGRAVPQHHRPQ